MILSDEVGKIVRCLRELMQGEAEPESRNVVKVDVLMIKRSTLSAARGSGCGAALAGAIVE